jgi:hypothetical protein
LKTFVEQEPKKRPIEEASREVKPHKKSKRKSTTSNQVIETLKSPTLHHPDLYITKQINPTTKNLDIFQAVALWEEVIDISISTHLHRKVLILVTS